MAAFNSLGSLLRQGALKNGVSSALKNGASFHSIVCSKLLSTNGHLGRRIVAHHLKHYVAGSRNGVAILDSDKTLLCLRNALSFIGALIRQKGNFFFLKSKNPILHEIMENMASYIKGSQWRIGDTFTNSIASSKKIRKRRKKIQLGLNEKPDCVVVLDANADRKSSVIREAYQSQIPIVSLVDCSTPFVSYKKITYPIPGNDAIQLAYFLCQSITLQVTVSPKSWKPFPQITGKGQLVGVEHLRKLHSVSSMGDRELDGSILRVRHVTDRPDGGFHGSYHAGCGGGYDKSGGGYGNRDGGNAGSGDGLGSKDAF